MKKNLLLAVFLLPAIFVQGQTFNFNDGKDISAFKEWVSLIKMQGKGKNIDDALTQKIKQGQKKAAINAISINISEYEKMDLESFIKEFVSESRGLILVLENIEKEYEYKLLKEYSRVKKPADAMQKLVYSEKKREYAKEKSYFYDFTNGLENKIRNSRDLKSMYFAAAKVKAMQKALLEEEESLFQNLKKEFIVFADKAELN